jgi:xanthine dehydrogenase small subunit
MLSFILNDQDITTDLPTGMTVLDLVRYHRNLKGTKIGCREGDCGACTVLVGELVDDRVRYRSMTSCLMPLANAAGKHIVTIEGINPPGRELTPVQQAMVDTSGTQCGFCTVGFVMSLTGYCLDDSPKTGDAAVSAIDGNICRCTGYKSIERAAELIASMLSERRESGAGLDRPIVPQYFTTIAERLRNIRSAAETSQETSDGTTPVFVAGGTDVYVQKPEQMAENQAAHLFYDPRLRAITDKGDYIELGASVTVTDLIDSPVMQAIFPNLYKHLKLVSSTPIRNMATLAGNFINASPIGDMTAWFLALDAEIDLSKPSSVEGQLRTIKLRDLYLGYKQLAKSPDEYISAIRFRKPTGDFPFNFEKVSKRTYLDIASVNTAISLTMDGEVISRAHVSAGGVAPIPLYLAKTSEFLEGRSMNEETIDRAIEIMRSEIAPISDVRGSAEYKRLLLSQLFRAHFFELFATELTEDTQQNPG